MAANTIGAITFDLLRASVPALKSRVDTFERDGFDGYGASLKGSGEARFPAVGVKYFAADSTALAHLQACAALQGTIVSLTNAFNETTANILVERVRDQEAIRERVVHLGNTSAVRVEIDFVLVRLT